MSSKTYFDEIAPAWDTMRSNFFPVSVREKAIAQIALKPNLKIADVGAGTGFITEGLADFPVEIYAVDESEKMLNFMQEKFSQQENIHYVVSESASIRLNDEQVNYALANMYLHHVEKPNKAIAEIYRILKPGGKLVLTDLDEHHFEFLKTEHNDRWMGFDRKDIIQWFENAGFKNVKVDCLNTNCCSDSCTSDAKASISIFIATGEK